VGPEFESVVFPRYSGFVTLPSGVQIRDLCVGDGAEVAGVEGTSALGASGSKDDGGGDGDGESVIVTIEWGMWTVHQGRMVTSLLPLAAAAVPASTSKISTAGKPVATATAGAAVVAAPETAGGGGNGEGGAVYCFTATFSTWFLQPLYPRLQLSRRMSSTDATVLRYLAPRHHQPPLVPPSKERHQRVKLVPFWYLDNTRHAFEGVRRRP
jgi:hypothetical protein